jgi:D-glycero-D-manno-heptose 1,7-bisphosphate phosphatase
MTGSQPGLQPAVFLDRDGVLNLPVMQDGRPGTPTSLDQLELYPEAPVACIRLRQLGYSVVVVSNQPDVARGTLDLRTLDAIHRTLRRRIVVDGLYVCPHDDGDHCGCRKPAPGLLLAAAADLGLDLGVSIMVGDRWRDIEAGQRAGCRTVHIDRRYHERIPESPDFVAGGLSEAVRWIENVVAGEGVTSG